MKISNYAALSAIVLAGFGAALYLSAQPRARAVETKNCQTNLKIIGLAMLQYNRDYDEKYPPAPRWADSLKPYAIGSDIFPSGSSDPRPNAKFDKMFHCPTTGSFYAYNRNLQTLTMERILPLEREPLVIEVAARQTKPNLSGAGELWPPSPVHKDGNHVLFADGHVELRQNKPAFRSFLPSPQPTATPTPTPRVGNQKQL